MRLYNDDKGFWMLLILMLLFSFILFVEGQRQLYQTVSNDKIRFENDIVKQVEKVFYQAKVSTEEEEETINLTDEDKYILTCVVAGESGNQSFDGKAAVAQCLFNAMKKDNLTVDEVVDIYQYSGWNEELQYSNPKAWEDCKLAVDAVFDVGFKLTDENILWFYNPNIFYSSFHESQKYIMTIGAHKFFAPWEDNNG